MPTKVNGAGLFVDYDPTRRLHQKVFKMSRIEQGGIEISRGGSSRVRRIILISLVGTGYLDPT